jgi:alpha/beta superfamily hydrolase
MNEAHMRDRAASWLCAVLLAVSAFPPLAAAQAAAAPRRPQEAAIERNHRPYKQVSVHFNNPAATVILAGTFSAPIGKGPFPTVLLIAASGPLTRDEEAEHHKIFVVLADYLNGRGVAVPRYDKRGVGSSTGHFDTTRFADFVSDAKAATKYLDSRPEVDRRCTGILGHSEGGTVAAEVAAQTPSIAFLVFMAGSGTL